MARLQAVRTITLGCAIALGCSVSLTACATPPTSVPATTSASATPSPEPAPTTPSPTSPAAITGTPSTVTTGLDAPWSIVFLRGTALISERDSGRILELLSDGSTREIGTVADVRHGGEAGLLGLVIDDQDRLYAYSTAADGNRIQRFGVTGEPGSFALDPAETILGQLPAGDYHDGGRLAFGPDGMLYATVGDAGQARNAQDLGSLAGKILRMTPDGGVPADNPFPGLLIYSYGHRNPQGLAWADDGTMFSAEFGLNTWDELNIITPGANYGWPEAEGVAGIAGFTDPVQQWAPSAASPSGMTHVRGTLFIANLRGTVLRAVPVADPTTSTEYFAGEFGRIRTVIEAPDGALWFVTNNTDGQASPGPEDDRIIAVPLE